MIFETEVRKKLDNNVLKNDFHGQNVYVYDVIGKTFYQLDKNAVFDKNTDYYSDIIEYDMKAPEKDLFGNIIESKIYNFSKVYNEGKREKILLNRAKCTVCNDVVISNSTHSLVRCKCNRMFVDGGNGYLRKGAENFDNVIEQSIMVIV